MKEESKLWASELNNIITNLPGNIKCAIEHLDLPRNLEKITEYSLNSLKGRISFLECAEVLYSGIVVYPLYKQ